MLATRYPSPAYDIIVEPFAGSAAYSLHDDYWQKRVILCDINEMVAGIWKYLQSATEKDIISLPDPAPGTNIRKAYSQLLTEELDLIGLHIGIGKPTRRSVVGKFSRWSAGKSYIAENLHKIKHWEIFQCDYRDVPFHGKATWFIDPPYQYAGSVYKHHRSIDYSVLADWIKKRNGQVIVCGDYDRDTWLPFNLLGNTKSAGRYKSKEGIFHAHQ